jgi:N-acetylmuramoyl-L-alanine amidase
MIGEDGNKHSLRTRAAAARGAALFVSIHHDSVKPQYLSEWMVDGVARYFADDFGGFSLFVSHDNPDLQRSVACATWIGANLRAAGYTPSLYHADPLRGEDRPFADKVNGVHFYDQLVVLGTATQAALLLEAGVLVNRDEELMLAQPHTRATIAQAVADGVRSCLP